MDFESLVYTLIGIGLAFGVLCSAAMGLIIPTAEKTLKRTISENERRIVSLAVPFVAIAAVLGINGIQQGALPSPLFTGACLLVGFIAATGKQGAYTVYQLVKVYVSVRNGITTPPRDWRGDQAAPEADAPRAFALEGPGPRIVPYPGPDDPAAPVPRIAPYPGPGDPAPPVPRPIPSPPPAPPALSDPPASYTPGAAEIASEIAEANAVARDQLPEIDRRPPGDGGAETH